MKKRSVMIAGHATSIAMEEEFWDELKSIAGQKKLSLNALVTEIDQQKTDKGQNNLSSAIRVYILKSLK